ncbi:MAG: AMP-binding protein [Prevotella sp.]|nr:AMP-binding protein [Candidatus Prevotella equi]
MRKDFSRTAIFAAERNINFHELTERISIFAAQSPKTSGSKTIILSENREGWIYAFYGIWKNNGIAVPVDATSTVEDVAYIIKDCQPECIWTSKKKIDLVEESMKEAGVELPVLIIDDYENSPLPSASDASKAPKAEDYLIYDYCRTGGDKIAVIIYTSGTTGSPKGVMLTCGNIQANVRGVSEEVEIFDGERTTIMLLPVHHILPLMASVIVPITSYSGVAICPGMSGPEIMETLCRGKVGIFVGVPRLWQTLYTGIKKKIDSSVVTRTLFNICKAANSRTLSRIIFSSVRKKMGGHLDYCVSGGAALDREIAIGLRTLGLDVLEGYGMTETAPIIAFTRPDDIVPGCVGLPLPSVECKIINGELCAKGPNLMKGYYNRPEETAAVIDGDGFIHTGDLARFDEKGRVYITGRSKEIIVLSNGKNVQPNEIEYKLEKFDTQVKEAAVTQDGDMLAAIIVPQSDWASTMTDEEIEETLKREVIEPYNRTVENYKKLMRLYVYRGDLPRTKLDKLKRFQLKDIISGQQPAQKSQKTYAEPQFEEYQILKAYIEKEKQLTVRPSDHIETDLAFDSLDRVEMQEFIEQTFGMKMNADSMASYKNITAMAEFVADARTKMEVETTDWSKLLNNDTTSLTLPTTSFTHIIYENIFKGIFSFYNRLSVKGTENIPQHSQFILAPNHQSYMDAPLAMAGIPTHILNDCYFYATEEHVNNSFLKFMARRHNIILMERKNLKESILKLAEVLKQGKNIVIFPEGSRTRSGNMSAFKKTFAILAKELNVPIMPVCIDGAYKALPRGQHYMKPEKITVTYLPLVIPSKEKSYDEISAEVKDSIASKL